MPPGARQTLGINETSRRADHVKYRDLNPHGEIAIPEWGGLFLILLPGLSSLMIY